MQIDKDIFCKTCVSKLENKGLQRNRLKFYCKKCGFYLSVLDPKVYKEKNEMINNQISKTKDKITELNKQIEKLNKQIENLENSLDKLDLHKIYYVN